EKSTNETQAVEQKITPWEVEGAVVDGQQVAVDYTNLIKKFGTQLIDNQLLERFERVTGAKPHIFLRRGIFFSHRDMGIILDRYEQKKPFYLYTGRGPSKGRMHLGHMLPFSFCKWLQDVFDVPLVIQLTDDEKFLFKTGVSLEDTYKYSFSTVREISALGFKPNKTFIFSDLDYMGGNFYRNIIKISKSITGSTARAVFGFTESDCIGKVFYPSIQIAPCFSNSFPDIFGDLKGIPCLIPCGIDQDPYFRLTRDISVKLGYPKPALLHSKFLPSLQGSKSKMSTSVDNTAIFTDDTPAMVKNKIRRHAFSGGGSTLELHRLNGGDPEVDIPYQYMNFFVDDDELMKKYYDGYKSGDITSGQMKDYCIDVIQKFLADFQEKEKAVTDQDVLDFMNPKYPRKFDLLKF
ncbi:Tryptophan-tRNA ligase, cytoplasmic, partial [Smittium culicis]